MNQPDRAWTNNAKIAGWNPATGLVAKGTILAIVAK